MIRLLKQYETAIRIEGEKSYPDECCGLILGIISNDGVERKVADILPVENARTDGEAYHRFVITPEDFLRAELIAASRGLDVIGVYHSHPDHPAEPSDYDLEHALPFYSYIIVKIDKGKSSDLTSWQLSPDRSRFDAEDIVRTDK
jgi:proteasome lid subunit RPN8/RPN11